MNIPVRLRRLAPVLLVAAVAGCGSSRHPGTRVSISGYAYHRATITIAAGTPVTFTDHDQTAHTATADRGGFDTGTIDPGKSVTVIFRRPGTYAYYCQFHPFMNGTVIVK